MENSPSNSNCYENQIHSPDLFSSEDEFECSEVPAHMCKPVNEEHKGNLVLSFESARLQRLQELLQGVPPPPSITIPQISVSDVLRLWKENATKIKNKPEKSNQGEYSSTLWKPNTSFATVQETTWPDAKSLVFHGVYYNLCTESEELERLSQKLHERYVGAETSAWCNAVSKIPGSTKKRQRGSGFGNISPGCRLSHLARRRQTFSSANLQQLSSASGSGKTGGVPIAISAKRNVVGIGGGSRRLMVEIKKSEKNKRIKICKDSAKNTNVSQSSNSQIATDVGKGSSKNQGCIQATKRALFQSPEEQQAVKTSSVSSEAQRKMQKSKRALWPSAASVDGQSQSSDSRKRSLDEDDTRSTQPPKSLCPENPLLNRLSSSSSISLNHSKNSGLFNNDASKASGSEINPYRTTTLSDLHKRKLFWAISQGLRKEGVTNKHPKFRSCVAMLVHHYMQVRKEWTGPAPSSTSEHMLNVVSAFVSQVTQIQVFEKGQEENRRESQPAKKGDKCSKELFKDATATLNVRRNFCGGSSSTLVEEKSRVPQKRVPSARKSLSFEFFGSKDSSVSSDGFEVKFQSENNWKDKLCEDKKQNHQHSTSQQSVNVKKVSRTLFLSPTQDLKNPAEKDTNDRVTENREAVETAIENSEGSKSASEFQQNGSAESTTVKTYKSSIEEGSLFMSSESTQQSKDVSNKEESNDVFKEDFDSEYLHKVDEAESPKLPKVRKLSLSLPKKSDCSTISESAQLRELRADQEKFNLLRVDSVPDNASSKNTLPDATREPEMTSSLNGGGLHVKEPPPAEGSSSIENDSSSNNDEQTSSKREDSSGTNMNFKVLSPVAAFCQVPSPKGSLPDSNMDLTFRGRIESLKPVCVSSESNVDVGLTMNISANILGVEENREKGADLLKWAERASRSAVKETEQDSKDECTKVAVPKIHTDGDNPANESLPPWADQSQLESMSEFTTNIFEDYRSIFDNSSHENNS